MRSTAVRSLPHPRTRSSTRSLNMAFIARVRVQRFAIRVFILGVRVWGCMIGVVIVGARFMIRAFNVRATLSDGCRV